MLDYQITTHVPGFAERMPQKSLRFIESVEGEKFIRDPDDETIKKIADALGVFPTPISTKNKKVLVCVEGPNDVNALKHLSRIIHNNDQMMIDLGSDERVIVFPLGGSTLKAWVQNQYFQKLELPEIHIYDRDTEDNPKNQVYCVEVNNRSDDSKAFLTEKRELENYIHPDVIYSEYGVKIEIDDWLDVPKEIAKCIHENAEDSKPWEEVTEEKKKEKVSKVKKRLNDDVIKKMSYEQLCEIDKSREVEKWLNSIMTLCEKNIMLKTE